jgi:hypothetical protein
VRRWRSKLAVALGAVVVAAMVTTPSAQASGACSTQANYFDDYFQAGHPEYQFEGVSAYMVVQDGLWCSPPPSPAYTDIVFSWVLIGAQEPNQGWGQVGWMHQRGSHEVWFSQFWDGYNDPLQSNLGTASIAGEHGVRHTFRVLFYPSCGCLHATIDSTLWDVSAFDPYVTSESNWGKFPWRVEYGDETTYQNDDPAGQPDNKVHISGMGAQQESDDSVVSVPCILSVQPPIYEPFSAAHHATSCTVVDVWAAP